MGNRRKNKQQKNQNAEQLEKKNVEHTDNTIESFEFPSEKKHTQMLEHCIHVSRYIM